MMRAFSFPLAMMSREVRRWQEEHACHQCLDFRQRNAVVLVPYRDFCDPAVDARDWGGYLVVVVVAVSSQDSLDFSPVVDGVSKSYWREWIKSMSMVGAGVVLGIVRCRRTACAVRSLGRGDVVMQTVVTAPSLR